MSDSSNEGCAGLLILILQVSAWLLSGVVAWNFVNPHSFGGALLFLFAWSVLGGIFHFLAMMIGILIFGNK